MGDFERKTSNRQILSIQVEGQSSSKIKKATYHKRVKIIFQMVKDALTGIAVRTFTGVIITISNATQTIAKIPSDLPGRSKLAGFEAGQE
jgi:hypothetical protein